MTGGGGVEPYQGEEGTACPEVCGGREIGTFMALEHRELGENG